MVHQLLGALDRRLGDGRDQVLRAPGGHDRPVDQPDVLGGDALGVGVDVEDDGVPGGDDRDGVVDDRRGWVRGRRDGGHDAEGRELGHHHPLVARDRLQLQVLRPRGLRRDQAVLLDLVGRASQPGFRVGHLGQALGVLEHGGPHRDDDGLPPLQPHGLIAAERPGRRGHGLVDRGVDPVAELRLGGLRQLLLRPEGRPGTTLAGLSEAAADPLDDLLDLLFR